MSYARRMVRSPGRAPIARKVLRDDVYDALLDMLVDDEFAAGAALSIEALARELGVSPTPVREALVFLEHTGLVSRTALKGYRVAPPLAPAEIAELVEARMVVELAAVEHAATRLPELLPHLEKAHSLHANSVADLESHPPDRITAASIRHYFEADWGFHVTIMENSGNRYLRRMLEGLGAHVHRFRQYVGHGISDAETALSEHEVVLNAFRAGDGDAAVRAMRQHIEAVRDRASTEQRAHEEAESSSGRSAR